MELEGLFPVEQKPEYTEGYEGFYLLVDITGSVDHTVVNYIIRDHFMDRFEEKKAYFKKIVDFLNDKYGNIITIEIEDSYYNMKKKLNLIWKLFNLLKNPCRNLRLNL